MRGALERRVGSEEEQLARRDRGVPLGSGLVGEEGLLGVVTALVAGWAVARSGAGASAPSRASQCAQWQAVVVFAELVLAFWRPVREDAGGRTSSRKGAPHGPGGGLTLGAACHAGAVLAHRCLLANNWDAVGQCERPSGAQRRDDPAGNASGFR